ncbi:uncharacterized protein LOC131690871 [Topomyia yanbarensis]|uniref:uncharacterized protein LOC131690871 n=1 Tax=Topomyia yanbarensis TaxID=2498891 RepID=UPI00273B543A|nr:uncharacterized protein LOC131690871 [Topomyia yanbarensis]
MIISQEQHLNILDLPNEIQLQIFDYLNLRDRKNTSRVCRLWNVLSFSGRFLDRICLQLSVEGDSFKCIVEVLSHSSRRYRHIVINFNNRDIVTTHGLRVSDGLETLALIGLSRLKADQLIELLENNPRLNRLFLIGEWIDVYRKTCLLELPTLKMDVLHAECFPTWLSALSADSSLVLRHLANLCVLVPSLCKSELRSLARICPDPKTLQLTGTDPTVASLYECYHKQLEKISILSPQKDFFHQFCGIGFPKLDYLYLDRLEIHDQQTVTSCINFFENKLHCVRLQTLILHHLFMIRTPIFTTICHNCLALRTLELSLNYLNGDALKEVTNLSSLQKLTLQGTAYFHETPHWANQIVSLTTVTIAGNRFPVPMLEFIADIAPNLQSLTLEDVAKPPEIFYILPTLVGNIGHLEMGYSHHFERPPSCHPSGFLRNMNNLKTYSIRRVTINHGIQGWLQDAPQLRSVTIADCSSLTDTHLVILTTNCPKLRQLQLKGCPGVTEKGIGEFRSRVPLCSVSGDMD